MNAPRSINDADLTNWFAFHAAQGDDGERYERLRAAGLAFARVILAETPPSADQSAAIRMAREAVMTANAAIACRNRA
jgi:hypothetical protein